MAQDSNSEIGAGARRSGSPPGRPRAWRHGFALVLTLLMPGLGHVLQGWAARGLAVWSAVLAVGTAVLLAFSIFFPPLYPTLVVLLILWMALLGLLWRDLERLGRSPQPPPPAWIVPVYFLCVGVVPVAAGLNLCAQYLVGSARVTDDSMFPRLVTGDQVLFDRRAHRRRTPRAGDLVVVDLPGQPESIVRVVAVGGQTVHLRRGLPVVDGQPLERTPALQIRVPRMAVEEAERLSSLLGYREGPVGRQYVVTWDAEACAITDPEPVRLRADEVFVVGDQRAGALAHGAFGRVRLAQVLGVPRMVWTSEDPAGHARAGRGGLVVE